MMKPPDKNVIAFCGEVEFISPIQIWVIQGGWQLLEKNKFWKKFLNLKINTRISRSNVCLEVIKSWQNRK